jgi:glycosyltransferase involved in cell wall biosynthesis
MKLKRKLDSFMPDIIHTHLKSSSYILFYYLFRKKTFKWIHTVHTYGRIDTKFFRRFLFRRMYQNRKIKLVAVSNTVKNSLVRLYKKPDITVINNGIDLSKFNVALDNRNYIQIINVGRFAKVKNHEYIIFEFSKLVKDIPSVKLVLIGDGPLKERITELTKKLNITKNVTFITYTDEVNRYLSESNIFVLPSYYEGLPLSLLEAMASGLVCVAGSGGKDLIKDNVNGFLIDLKSGSLYKKLLYIIDNFYKMQNIKLNAINTSRNYSIETMAKRYLYLYLEVADD